MFDRRPVPLETGCFQIGTVRFSSSTIHWLAERSRTMAPSTRTSSDASPTATKPIR